MKKNTHFEIYIFPANEDITTPMALNKEQPPKTSPMCY